MPDRREQRCHLTMDTMAGACVLICLVNVVFISIASKIASFTGLSNFPRLSNLTGVLD